MSTHSESISPPLVEELLRRIDAPVIESLAREHSPLLLGLAALALATEQGAVGGLSADQISKALDSVGIAVSARAIQKAFARAGPRVSRRHDGNVVKYRAMVLGRKEVEGLINPGNLSVIYVEGNRPHTDRRKFSELLADLTGAVRITDPYYGARSLDILEQVPSVCRILFLTSRTSENQEKTKRLIKDFLKERPSAEIAVYPHPEELHDRYVLSDRRLMLVGHGLKDIGNRESFVIVLNRSEAADLIDSVEATFDQRWAKATPI